MDQDIQANIDTANNPPQPPPNQAQPDLDQAELARLRELATKFAPLAGIAEALEADPSKYFAVEAALRGQQLTQPQTQNQPQRQQLTPEQLAEVDARFQASPTQTSYDIAKIAAREVQQEILQQANPLMGATGDLMIDSFKNGKSGSDPLYKQILPLFERQLGDINRQSLIGMSAGDRSRALELRWSAAKSQVYDKAAAQKQNDPPPHIGGGGGAPIQTKPKTAIERDDTVSGLTAHLKAMGLLTDDDISNVEKEIEAENQ